MRKHKLPSKEFLELQYYKNKKSILKISKELKTPYSKLYFLFKKLNIKIRTRSEALRGKIKDKEWIEKISKNHANVKAEKNGNWKGGIKKSWGYIYIFKPEHPKAIKKYVKRANLIIEAHIGRYLEPNEEVHHKNGNKEDDNIKNLVLCKNKTEHQKLHWLDLAFPGKSLEEINLMTNKEILSKKGIGEKTLEYIRSFIT